MTGIKKSAGKFFSLVVTVAFICLVTSAAIPGVMGANPVELGTASGFAVLAKSAITDTLSSSVISGDVGLSPTTGAAIVGFDTCTQVSGGRGTIYKVNAPGPVCATNDPILVGTAVADMESAYSNANSGTADFPPSAGEIGGRTLIPGNYSWTGAVTMGNDVTLDGQGDANAVWIIRTAGALTLGAGKKIILINGAQPNHVFWTTAGYTELGADSVFNGNILAAGYITLNNGATLNGRALAQTAVTLEKNTVTVPVLRFAPVAAFTFTNATGIAPLTVAFTDISSHDPAATIIGWDWDFNNDGIIDSILQNPVYVYDTAAIYTPNLTVTDSYGAVATKIDTVTVYQAPVADFSSSPASGPTYLTVAFTDLSTTDPPATITGWAWDFDGDDIIDNTTRNPVNMFYTVGDHAVKLTVTDSRGATSSKLDTVTVTPASLGITVTNVPFTLALNPDMTSTSTDIQFYVNSTTNWQVAAYDADPTTSGFMAHYVTNPVSGYVIPAVHLTRPFMVRHNSNDLYENLPAGSGSATLIQSGVPEESATAYLLGVQQDVTMEDSVLPVNNVYRIVVTLTVSSI